MDKISEIVLTNRQRGNSTWILKAAIKQPNCIILSKNMKQAKFLERDYYRLLSKENWFKKQYWKLFGRKNPMFLSIDCNLRGYREPIIFDNGALFFYSEP